MNIIEKFIIPTPMFNVIIDGEKSTINEYTLRNLQLAVSLGEITSIIRIEDSDGLFIRIESDGRLSCTFKDNRYKITSILMSDLQIFNN
jgi:hypothetical protein